MDILKRGNGSFTLIGAKVIAFGACRKKRD
jgi:hypothetical protein